MIAVPSASPAGDTPGTPLSTRPRVFPRVDAEQAPQAQVDALLAGAYEFNGERHVLGLDPDWLTNPSADIEWHILLHKFYYAPALVATASARLDPRYLERWMALTESWIRNVPAGFIAADVTGRRVQNWLYAWELARDGRYAHMMPAAFVDALRTSLIEQTRYLCAHLTPKRNHRTLELHAIIMAGVALPDHAEAAAWRRFALDELLANMRLDLLPDGVHCELSTDYHHLVVRNLLSARALVTGNGGTVPAEFDRLLCRALDFSLHAHNPAGMVPSFSDGDAHSYTDLLAQAATLYGREDYRYVASGGTAGRAPDRCLARFPNAGYYILRSGWGRQARSYRDEHHLVFDCGPLGEGNHGHMDCLSFELHAAGRRLIVDPGRYTYSEAGDINWRAWFRGTAAHNTVTIDGCNQARYAPKPAAPGTRHPAGQLRHRILGPGPAASLLAALDEPDCSVLVGAAQSAEYAVRHVRHIFLLAGRYWLIVDRLDARDLPTAQVHRYEARLQLAPESAAGGIDCSSLQPRWCGRDWQILTTAGRHLAMEPGWVSDTYGEKHAAPRLLIADQAVSTWIAVLIDPEGTRGVSLREWRSTDACRYEVSLEHCSFEIHVGESWMVVRHDQGGGQPRTWSGQ